MPYSEDGKLDRGYQTNFGPVDSTESSPTKGIVGGVLGLSGAALGIGTTRERTFGVYDPSMTALSRYRELTDPSSNFHRRLQSLYSRYFAEGAPTINSLLGVAQASGINGESAATLAYQKSRQIATQNNEQVLNALQREQLNVEQSAQGYLGMHYQMLRDQSNMNYNAYNEANNSQGSFANELLSLGGSLLSKVLL